MIIISTDEEKTRLEKACSGECEYCLLKFLSDTGDCPIENRQIVVVEKDTYSKVLFRGE